VAVAANLVDFSLGELLIIFPATSFLFRSPGNLRWSWGWVQKLLNCFHANVLCETFVYAWVALLLFPNYH
jgi:hypothetical protein